MVTDNCFQFVYVVSAFECVGKEGVCGANGKSDETSKKCTCNDGYTGTCDGQ